MWSPGRQIGIFNWCGSVNQLLKYVNEGAQAPRESTFLSDGHQTPASSKFKPRAESSSSSKLSTEFPTALPKCYLQWQSVKNSSIVSTNTISLKMLFPEGHICFWIKSLSPFHCRNNSSYIVIVWSEISHATKWYTESPGPVPPTGNWQNIWKYWKSEN